MFALTTLLVDFLGNKTRFHIAARPLNVASFLYINIYGEYVQNKVLSECKDDHMTTQKIVLSDRQDMCERQLRFA